MKSRTRSLRAYLVELDLNTKNNSLNRWIINGKSLFGSNRVGGADTLKNST